MFNFIVGGKYAYGHEGHLPAQQLMARILAHGGTTAYHCAFNLEKRETFKGYQGKVAPALGRIWFDLDGPNALSDTRAFVEFLNVPDLVLFYSGSKGFHVGLPHFYLPLPFDEFYNRKLKDIAHALKEDFGSIDTTVYNAARKFRVPNSRHEKTQLFKILITREQLKLSLEEIKLLAARPQPMGNIEIPQDKTGPALSQLEPYVNVIKDEIYQVHAEEMDESLVGKMKAHPKKICIERMEKEIAPDGHKHQVGLRLISDYKNRSMPIMEARKKLLAWCKIHQLDPVQIADIEAVLEGIYSGEAYQFGCSDEYKSSKCSAKCAIYKFLNKETRPVVIDAPAKEVFTEQRVAEKLLEQMNGSLVRQEDSIFEYRKTHWVELTRYEKDHFQNIINGMCGNRLESKQTKSIYNTFFRQIPHVPPGVNLFIPNENMTNFLDATVFVSRDDKTGVYTIAARAHRPEDYLGFVIPINYHVDRSLKNPLWEKLIEEALEGDADGPGKLRALKQMAGAMLLPCYAQMFFLYGASGSRKSTMVLTLQKLLAKQNVSAVQPSDMDGFQIEGMMGKLVNIHTDIDDQTPIPRGFIKRFEDATPIQVNRKGKTVMNSRIARFHVYCANELPPNFEGVSRALLRRLTLIYFGTDRTNGADGRQLDSVIKQYEDVIWAAGAEGILNWALEGLTDLVNSGGKFYQPASSIAGVLDWQKERDMVGQFMDCVNAGEIVASNTIVKAGETWRIKPAALWQIFVTWFEEVAPSDRCMGRNLFYKRILQRGVTKVTIRGQEHFAGIGVFEVEQSTF